MLKIYIPCLLRSLRQYGEHVLLVIYTWAIWVKVSADIFVFKRLFKLLYIFLGGKSSSSSQKTGAVHRNSSATRSASKRNSLQNKGSSNNLSTNASMGVLNQVSLKNIVHQIKITIIL